MTKDGGATWTEIQTPVYPISHDQSPGCSPSRPTTTTEPNYDVVSSSTFPQGNYTLSLAVDPHRPQRRLCRRHRRSARPRGLIRIDTTDIFDSHAFVAFDNNLNDGGQLEINTAGRIQVTNYKTKVCRSSSRPARSIST